MKAHTNSSKRLLLPVIVSLFTQILPSVAQQFVVESSSYNVETSTLSLTWTSSPGETFDIELSNNLEQWNATLETNLIADPGSSTTRTYELDDLNLESEDQLFIRIAKLGPTTPPNIIFLLSDDQTKYSVGCYGNPDVITPHQDKVGTDGIIFDRHYTSTAICMGSRANIFTGMYEYKHGCNFDRGNLTTTMWANSYPVLLRNAGYHTGFAGKIGIEGVDVSPGFDVSVIGPQRQSSYTTNQINGLEAYATEFPHATLALGAWGRDFVASSVALNKPFCMSISFKAPHRPTTPDPRFNNIYVNPDTGGPITFTKPGNYGRVFGDTRPPQMKTGRQWPRFTQWGYDSNYDNVMATYHRQVYGIDQAVKMIRDEVIAQGIENNTVIIYTSDNGFLCGSHGFASKVLPIEEASAAPLMIYDPRATTSGQGFRCNRLTGNIDFAPTILDLAGLPVPQNMDGKSLVPLLSNPSNGGHDQLALMNVWDAAGTTALTIVSDNFKYTYWWSDTPEEELYDLANDPLELNDLSQNPTFANTLNTMRTKYDEQLQHWKDNGVSTNGYPDMATNFTR